MLNHLRQSWSLKIGLLTHSVNPRGGVIHTLELANALHAAGHEVTVFAPATKGQRMFRPVPFRLQLVQIDVHDRDVPAMVETRINAFERHLTHLLLEEQFDVLHAQDPIGANALANLREQGLIDGFIRTVHHLDRFTDARLHHWQARGMQAASEVLCVSQLWTDSLLRDHNIYARTVQNGVDLNRYKSEPDSEDALLKTRLGLRGGLDAPVILAVGGIEERKNSIRLLQAFSQLRIDFPKAQLVIAGGSSLLNHDRYSAKFFEEMQGLNMAIGKPLRTDADVVVTGPLADIEMPALFRCADVLAMPSLNEGFGLVVLESLACGTPVLVSNIAPSTYLMQIVSGLIPSRIKVLQRP
jgi:glycosyltransferase-like protein